MRAIYAKDPVGTLRIPSFSNDPINTGKRRQFEQDGREAFDQRPLSETPVCAPKT
jgi:hypothetical protein